MQLKPMISSHHDRHRGTQAVIMNELVDGRSCAMNKEPVIRTVQDFCKQKSCWWKVSGVPRRTFEAIGVKPRHGTTLENPPPAETWPEVGMRTLAQPASLSIAA